MKVSTQAPRAAGTILRAIGIIWGSLSLLFLFLGLRLLRTEQRFGAESIALPGVITSKWVQEKNGIDPTTKRPIVTRTFYLKVTFRDDRGQEREINESVDSDRWESVHEQDPVDVQFLPDAPTQSRLADKSRTTHAFVLTGLGAAGALMGLSIARVHRRNGSTPPPR
jgi:hypothetical protein